MTFEEWYTREKYMSYYKPVAKDAWETAKKDSQVEIDYLKDLLQRIVHGPFTKLAEIITEYEQREFPELWQNIILEPKTKLPKKGGSKRATKALKKLRRK